jgi:hypothetical protein
MTQRRVSVGCAVVSVVLITSSSLLTGCQSRDDASYRYGYEEVSPWATTMSEMGYTVDAEYQCEQALAMQTLHDAAAGDLDEGDVIAGCVDGLQDR